MFAMSSTFHQSQIGDVFDKLILATPPSIPSTDFAISPNCCPWQPLLLSYLRCACPLGRQCETDSPAIWPWPPPRAAGEMLSGRCDPRRRRWAGETHAPLCRRSSPGALCRVCRRSGKLATSLRPSMEPLMHRNGAGSRAGLKRETTTSPTLVRGLHPKAVRTNTYLVCLNIPGNRKDLGKSIHNRPLAS